MFPISVALTIVRSLVSVTRTHMFIYGVINIIPSNEIIWRIMKRCVDTWNHIAQYEPYLEIHFQKLKNYSSHYRYLKI